VIDVSIVPHQVGIEALKEIETMQSLDSPYVIGYYDSFIDDQKINIIL
jgi:serine/threonine protein kinase